MRPKNILQISQTIEKGFPLFEKLWSTKIVIGTKIGNIIVHFHQLLHILQMNLSPLSVGKISSSQKFSKRLRTAPRTYLRGALVAKVLLPQWWCGKTYPNNKHHQKQFSGSQLSAHLLYVHLSDLVFLYYRPIEAIWCKKYLMRRDFTGMKIKLCGKVQSEARFVNLSCESSLFTQLVARSI